MPLRIRPEPNAPEIGRVAANEAVRVKPAPGDYALVETDGGLRGYAPASSFPGQRPAVAPAGGEGGGMRELAASNIAKPDNSSESVTNAEHAAQGQGFEVAG